MKSFLLVAFLMISPLASSEVSPDEVGSMIDKMVKDNVISAEEGVKAKAKLKNLNQEEWSGLNAKAEDIAVNRAPASIAELKGENLDAAQFKQIQADIKKVAPEYKGQ